MTLQTADLSTFQGTGEIWLSLNVANHTGSDLALSLDQRNVILETNTGVRFKPFYSEGDTSVWQQTVENGDREDVRFHYSTRYSWLGDYFAPGVNYVRVIVRDWSRMNEGIWQIDINH